MLEHQHFAIDRVMPNDTVMTQATASFVAKFAFEYEAYRTWNQKIINEMGAVEGYDRSQLVADFIRGTMINSDDASKCFDDLAIYRQFCYALLQLLGHSDSKVPEEHLLQQILFEQ
ncbi:hypothetical protein [Shewanella sp. NIFS-20-20]|uniref:hypothetical protein n=1 Tax=Shewanella sp. NIFS-20-20 TaxID=2853806 RepID=UPI001C449E1A|nr:hypothetical protein [Shewanella sp. NIFS-20-20]MBV7317522.1 hypothetical protein [Shewanella sp. NIFS-20-20]